MHSLNRTPNKRRWLQENIKNLVQPPAEEARIINRQNTVKGYQNHTPDSKGEFEGRVNEKENRNARDRHMRGRGGRKTGGNIHDGDDTREGEGGGNDTFVETNLSSALRWIIDGSFALNAVFFFGPPHLDCPDLWSHTVDLPTSGLFLPHRCPSLNKSRWQSEYYLWTSENPQQVWG